MLDTFLSYTLYKLYAYGNNCLFDTLALNHIELCLEIIPPLLSTLTVQHNSISFLSTIRKSICLIFKSKEEHKLLRILHVSTCTCRYYNRLTLTRPITIINTISTNSMDGHIRGR